MAKWRYDIKYKIKDGHFVVRICRECTGWRKWNESQRVLHTESLRVSFDLLLFTRETLAIAS